MVAASSITASSSCLQGLLARSSCRTKKVKKKVVACRNNLPTDLQRIRRISKLPSMDLEGRKAPAHIPASLLKDTETLNVEMVTKGTGTVDESPPKKIIVGVPTTPGTYPIILLFPGFFIPIESYKQIIKDISSQGFIVVGAQLYTYVPRSTTEDVKSAAALTNWLPLGLQNYLLPGIEPDFGKLTLAGHSRGSHTCLALAHGHAKTDLDFAALIALDPVLGQNKWLQADPKILTSKPESLELKIPILIVGSEFADKGPFSCAPDGVNHKQLCLECKQPRQHFVIPGSGHMDFLDDDAPVWTKLFFKHGHCRATMRHEFVELTTAFLHTTYQRDKPEFNYEWY